MTARTRPWYRAEKPLLVYLIGVPGAGKSAVMAELVRGRRRRVFTQPFAHTTYEDGLVQLGRERVGRSGTDTLAMNVQPRVLAMLETQTWSRVLGEGDRLANRAFFDGARLRGYTLDVILLDCPPEVAAERRAARGSEQDARWLKSRASKIENLRPLATAVLDATLPVETLVATLSAHPVITREES